MSVLSAPPPPRSSWPIVLVSCGLLLVLPLLAWVLFPIPDVASPASARATSASLEGDAPPAASNEPASLKGRIVRGSVSDEGGAGLSGALVRFEPERAAPSKSTILRTLSGTEGKFEMGDVPLAAGFLIATKDGYTSARVPLAVSAGDVAIRLRAAIPVRGTVFGTDGHTVPEAVVACDDRDPHLTTIANEEGKFQLSADAAGCLAVARHPSHGPSDRVRLDPDRDNTLRMGTAGGIAGVVVDEQGSAVSSYLLAVESFTPASGGADPMANRGAQNVADPAGAFSLEGLAAGKYVLTASAEGRPPARSQSVEVEAGRTTRGVRIVLSRGATLVGTVVDASTKKPIAGATVGLDAATSTGANAIGMATTDSEGAFSLPGVPSSRFSVRVTHDEYRTKIVPGLEARGATELRVELALQPKGDAGGDSELAGIGAVLLPMKGGIVVAGLVEGGPAEKAGVKKSDRLMRIDGTSTEGMMIPDCVQLLRGTAGSRVSVSIGRGTEVLDITITRDIVVR